MRINEIVMLYYTSKRGRRKTIKPATPKLRRPFKGKQLKPSRTIMRIYRIKWAVKSEELHTLQT
jgi:hypothetical protein